MKIIAAILFPLFFSGCASITSSGSSDSNADGLVYYMPKKDIQLTITVANGYPTDVKVGTSETYPDMSKKFYLRHSGGIIGKNVSDVQISNGLLTSTKSTMTSNVGDIFKNLAGAAATLKFRDKTKAEAAPRFSNACADGTHNFIVEAIKLDKTYCEVAINITSRPSTIPPVDTGNHNAVDRAGVFYRQNIPYLVQAVSKAEGGTGIHSSAMVFSPSESNVYFLPISRTFFANNEADFAFDKGVPTKFKQDTDGELVALATLPAVIFSAYFEAAGKVFDAFKTRDTKVIEGMQSDIAVETMKIKYEACMAAAQDGDEEKMVTLKCGEKL